MDRVEMLNDILAQNPNDAFARYGLALEYSNQGNTDSALAEFGKLLSSNPDYTPGYFMAAQTLREGSPQRRSAEDVNGWYCFSEAHRQCARAI